MGGSLGQSQRKCCAGVPPPQQVRNTGHRVKNQRFFKAFRISGTLAAGFPPLPTTGRQAAWTKGIPKGRRASPGILKIAGDK
jgi:hypothetical protein